jgi:hypothetical protein
MRPLIEILEDERTLNQRLEGVYRYLLKVDDCETIDILEAQRERFERDLEKTRNELRWYVLDLLKES